MNALNKITWAALLLTLAPLTTLAQDPQVITIPLSRPGEAMSLDISILSAHIEVIGEDRDDAQFEVSGAASERRIITPSGAKTIAGGAYSVEVEEEDNHVSVDADWRADRLTVVARIPRRADLELSTVNNGELVVRNIEGSLVLENTNGPITAHQITGSVIAQSINETIDVQFDALKNGGAMSFSSINGDLVLGLPDGAGVELHIDSAQGEITSDFEVEVKPSKPIMTREDHRDGVEVRMESVIIATVNGGGPVIKMKSLYGDIHIRRSGD